MARATEVERAWQTLVKTFADPRGGRGFGAGALKVDGHIFAMVSSRGELVFKLPAARVAALVAAGLGTHYTAGRRRALVEWIVIERPSPKRSLALAREAWTFVAEQAKR